ncbi:MULTISPECIES: RidA family protein [Campylobacter]|mgnify:FL=1|jgi:putative endoribonuclease L-PSP|uniref:Reactive intermediate/imine deaminase n=1 Tax=Campylobacter curvus (strain 525.92) TaxID=360105 RepID=A7H0N5_CAMC5|nr:MULTISPECIES: RidA family protein [Campylobacter]EAU01389.2 reactive intermediate/imine deaminase [Campylobacter curvus 525.92]EJP75915.1 putative endoribonuclease L-PSP [Campylobacter sp. FOBRC14]MBN7287758.1 RidA family protein [Campylobacter curvus]MDU6828148.1 RidA family protein [Campylobacter sp.]
MKKAISTTNAPKAIGPYSQAILANGFLFVSGQLGVSPGGEFTGSNVEAQAEQSMQNIKNILAEAGLGFENVVKTTIFLADMNDFAKVNEIYAKHFSEPFPARSTVAIKTLPKNALVEIEVVAVLKSK